MIAQLSLVTFSASAMSTQGAPPVPHLAQAWIAQSTGDGEPGAIGQERYLYETCGEGGRGPQSDSCIHAHVFDYGADKCIKLEIDAGLKSPNSGKACTHCDGCAKVQH